MEHRKNRFEGGGKQPSHCRRFMLNTIRKVCKLPKEKFYINLEETGNTVSSTVMIALKDCMDNGTIEPGMQVMILGFGVGLSWGGTLLKF